MDELKIGSTVWREMDRYIRRGNVAAEDQFLPLTIISETRVSWVAKGDNHWAEFKFPKKKPNGDHNKDPDTRLAKGRGDGHIRIYLSKRAVNDEIWGIKNRVPLRNHLEAILRSAGFSDIAELRRIATLVGYKETV
jgi:hypothetical protein